MDMLDPGLDPAASATAAAAASHDKGPEAEDGVELQEGGDGPGAEEQTAVAIASVQQAAFGDHNIQYQFRTENNGGQVTYRVVQVTDGQLDGQGDAAGAVSVVSTAAFAGGQQAVTQVGVDGAAQRPGPAAASVPPGPTAPFPLAVIQNPFSNGGSPAAEAVSGEARFAYFPASGVGDTTAVSVQTTDQSLQAGGQFYVMMTPQDVLQTGTQRTIAPRTHPYSPKIDGTRTPRDERRRAQHNEVERRRRDKINNWIVQLSKIIPDCNADNSKTGASKGGILSKACDYIRELRQTNQRMQETFKEAERLQMDNDLLRQQVARQKQVWPHRPRLLDTQFCWPQGDTTLLLFPLIFCLFGATTFLEMNSGQGVGGFTPLHPAPSRPHKSHSKLSPSTRASLTPACRTDRPEDRHTMSRSIQTQAACLLLLILASLASSSVLQRQTRQPTDLQTLDTAEAQTGLMPRLHRLWRRDTYIPVCIFCCKCCHNRQCGICCRT